MQTTFEHQLGGSADAIRYHYDLSSPFYSLWLDESMTYSCALWDEGDRNQTLGAAQAAKYDWHLKRAGVDRARSLLDIGCGWGGLLTAAQASGRLDRAVGLTLSQAQFDHSVGLRLPRTEIRLENWSEHVPSAPYDGIVSIGALEHFVRPEDDVPRKIEVYRHFFETCSGWLSKGGRMSLQTIAYGDMSSEDASQFINDEIFPSADLPRLSELAQAADRVIEITEVHNHRLHYARTFEMWAKNLRKKRRQAIDLVGQETTDRYIRYLTQSSIGFYMGKIQLLRLGLQKQAR